MTPSRTRRRNLLVGIVFLAVLSAILALLKSGKEPTYKGKGLSEWINEAETKPRGQPLTPETLEAFKNLGPEALPFLLKRLDDTEPKLRTLILLEFFSKPTYNNRTISEWVSMIGGIPRRPVFFTYDKSSAGVVEVISALGPTALPYLQSRLKYSEPKLRKFLRELINHQDLIPNPLPKPKEVDVYQICQALRILRTNSLPALRELRALLYTTDGSYSIASAIALGELGEPANPVFLEALASTNIFAKVATIDTIRSGPKIDDRFVAPLVDCLNSTNNGVRAMAFLALSEIQLQPEKVLPAFLEQLNDSEPNDAVFTLRSIEAFGEDAQICLPALESMLKHENGMIRIEVTNAIKTIAPERAASILGGN